MATTTNYAWETPDDTDLVKDGAAAIRTLGSSIDTTTKALNPSTTLGDIEYRSATANTNTRLGIGTTGQVLQVNGGVPSWATPTSGGMTLISTTTLTGASIVLSSIPATYNNLQLVIRDLLPATDGAGLSVRLNGDSASRYAFVAAGTDSTSSFGDTSFVEITGGMDNAVTQNLQVFNFYDYKNTVTWKYGSFESIVVDSTTVTQVGFRERQLAYNQTAAISSITLFMSAGNFTSGTALLYGVQ
jgi:hypothetical protein